MEPTDKTSRSGLADAAGHAAMFPARAAARALRGQIEEIVDDILSAPEIARVVDRALAGSLPEEIARSVARHRVLERIAGQLVATGEFDRLVTRALASEKVDDLADRVMNSEQLQRVVEHVASSPELRDAIARQTTGFADELVGGVRASSRRVDDRAERVVGRSARPAPAAFGGVATRAIALAADAALTVILYTSVVGVVSLIGNLVGGLRPEWLVGLLLAGGWIALVGAYFVVCWSATGQTPGMRLMRVRVQGDGGQPPSVARSALRFVGLVLSIVPLFAGFLPVLFTERRRGLADLLARTVVVYDHPPAPTA